MRLSLLLVSVLFVSSVTVSAQVTPIGGGCTPWGGAPNTPFAINGAQPQVGNSTFTMGYQPATFGTVACFWVIGLSEQGSVDFPAGLLCGGPPCGVAVDLQMPVVVGGASTPPFTIQTPLPIPGESQLVGAEICMQYLAFANVTCTGVSEGVKITIIP